MTIWRVTSHDAIHHLYDLSKGQFLVDVIFVGTQHIYMQ